MLANFEHREYEKKEGAWTGRYENLQNLPHWHLECEIIYIEEGDVTVSHNQTAYHLTKGDAVFIGSGEIHYIKGSPASITVILIFDAAMIQEITRSFQLSSPKLSHNFPIPAYCEKIKAELTHKLPFYRRKIWSLLNDLTICIFREEVLTQQRETRIPASIENYKNLLNEIEEKYNYITFEDASNFMGLSKPYFSRFFKGISGMTFSQYLNIIRMEKAIELLNHNPQQLTITDIASACGFDTIRHFNRVFKEFTSYSPRQLPENYVLTSRSIKSRKNTFDPTLSNSRLL